MKKIISILLCLAMLFTLFSVGAVSAGAADKAAPKWEQRQDGKVYFYADPKLMNGTITLYIYDHTTGEELMPWGSKKAKMTSEGNNIWSFDFAEKGITLSEGKQYGIIITSDWGVQTCDIIFSTECLGDMLYAREATVENNIDSNKRSYVPEWVNADRKVYGLPICITSIGNVVGTSYWADEDAYSLFVHFLSSAGYGSLSNAIKYNGQTARETAEYVADELGLTSDEFDRALDETGVDLDNFVPKSDEYYFIDLSDLGGVFADAQNMYAYIQDENGAPFYPSGSEEWKMEPMGENDWRFYFTEDDIKLDPDKSYTVSFTPDWKNSTDPLPFELYNYYDCAVTSGVILDDSKDGKVYEAEWGSTLWNDNFPWFYLKVDPEITGEPAQKVSAFICADGEEEGIFPIDSAESEMVYSSDEDRWEYELAVHGDPLPPGKDYTVTFVINSKFYTNPLHLTYEVYGCTARLTGDTFAGNGGKQIYEAEWIAGVSYEDYPAPEWEKRDDGKIYFYADQGVEPDFKKIYAYIFDYSAMIDQGSGDSGDNYGWGNKKYAMTYEGNGVWSYDPAAHGIAIEPGKYYGVYFTPDWDINYGDVELTADNLGDMAYVYRTYFSHYDENDYHAIDWVNGSNGYYILGDLNHNGELDIMDVTILQRHLAEFTENGQPIIDENDAFSMMIADVNGDGFLTIEDVTVMQRRLAEYVTEPV